MKVLLPVLLIALTSVAQADVSIKNDDMKKSDLILTVTGSDAVELKKIVLDTEGSLDSILKKGPNTGYDASSVRSVSCGTDSCQVVLSGEVFTNKDAQEYYVEAFNRKLLALADGEVLMTSSMGRGDVGTSAEMDQRFMRLLMEQSATNKKISVVTGKPGSLKNPDQISSLIYQLTLKTQNMKVTCYSSVVTGMSNRNYLEESCSFEVKAQVK